MPHRRNILGALVAGGLTGVAALTGETAQAADPADFFSGHWVQEDSGGVLQFLPGGRIVGWPTGGTYKLDDDTIRITSGGETLDCRWKKVSDDEIQLSRTVDGKDEPTRLQRLKPAPLDLAAWKGRYFIWHLIASKKRASGRAVILEPSGHFRSKEGGFYLRLTSSPNGGILAYASGEEDETLNVQVFKGGRYLVVFDRIENARLFASCMKVPGESD
jgi:hypothetical protein